MEVPLDPLVPHLAAMLRETREFAEPKDILRATNDAWKRMVGEDHPYTLAARKELADLLVATERFDEAEDLYRDMLATETD